MLSRSINPLVAVRFKARLHGFEFPLNIRLQLIEAPPVCLADFHRLLYQRFLKACETCLVVTHLRAEQDVAYFIDITGSSAQNLRTAVFTWNGGGNCGLLG